MVSLDGLLSVTCEYENMLQLVFLMMIFLFVLTLLSLVLGTAGTAAYLIAIFDAVLILGVGGLTGGLLWYCLNREESKSWEEAES